MILVVLADLNVGVALPLPERTGKLNNSTALPPKTAQRI
jgi:hypothetical protein